MLCPREAACRKSLKRRSVDKSQAKFWSLLCGVLGLEFAIFAGEGARATISRYGDQRRRGFRSPI